MKKRQARLAHDREEPRANHGPKVPTGGERHNEAVLPENWRYGPEDIPKLIARRNEAQDDAVRLGNENAELRKTLRFLLTREERSIVADLGLMAERIVAAIGAEDTDVNEICGHIHVLQSRVMQQAAARAYPGEFRLHLPRT